MNKRTFPLIFVILAGETIFMLPFMLPRIYRPLMMEAWGLTNTDFGIAFSAYGIAAMFSYLIGGPFADKYHPRVLMATSLVLTAVASLFLASAPTRTTFILTYGFYGVSTILLMWGALIKTTHIAGGEERRALAMGLLDGGRGLAAALFSSFLVLIVSIAVPNLTSSSDKLSALHTIYLSTGFFTFLVAVGVWLSLKQFEVAHSGSSRWTTQNALECFRNPTLWWLSLVILGSYCAYKGIDNFALYLVTVHKVGHAEASKFMSLVFWLRPVSTVIAGAITDFYHRTYKNARFLFLFAIMMLAGATRILLVSFGQDGLFYAEVIMLLTAALTFSLRSVYFSVFGDLGIPDHLVGTATGLVSFVGFLPEVFFGLATGYLIDRDPGLLGFQHAFLFGTLCTILGAAGAYFLRHRANSKPI